ncbi:MAG: SBBP repeat-containing protein [Bryobacteraceae bacterium]
MAINGLAPARGVSLWSRDTAGMAFIATAFFLMAGSVAASAQALPAFNWILEVDNSGLGYPFAGLGTDAQGNVYVVGSTKSLSFPVKNAVQSQSASPGSYDVFVTKFDPSGNVVYSTYFGGSADDIARVVVVDALGNVYVAGSTASTDFPTTAGSYAPSPPQPSGPVYTSLTASATFLFKLNPDGSVGYSTYFTSASALPQAIAVDGSGSVYLTGSASGGVPTTAGAYQTTCACGGPGYYFGPPIIISDAFLSKFDPTGSKLIYSTYVGFADASGDAVGVAADGSAYLGSPTGIYRFDPSGSSLLASIAPVLNVQAMAVGPDGRVYLAGAPGTGSNQFQPTTGAFQPSPVPRPALPGQGGDSALGIAIMDPQLENTLAATYFGDPAYGPSVKALALDSSGNVFFGGYTSRAGLPTRTPLQEGFGGSLATGFVSELSADLSTLLFSSQFGDGEYFGVTGLGIGASGSFALAGPTDHGTVWANSVQPADLPPLRIDAVENAASLLDDPLAPGETMVIRGAGFGSDAQLTLDGAVAPVISVTPGLITAAVPSDLAVQPVMVQVESGGAASNSVLLNVATASPGLFSADGTGFGQGYILNKDGTLNSPTNPATPGDKITIYATGVGPMSFTNGYAVTQFWADAYIDGFHCDGLAAVIGPVAGFPGAVYQLTVLVPNPAAMAATNPNLLNFTFPPQVGVVLQIDGASSQNGLAISIGQ